MSTSSTGFRLTMGYQQLLGKISSGSADPQAVLFYGADAEQLNEIADRLARYWLGADESRDLTRHVDFQKISPWGAGQQILKDAIFPKRGGDDDTKFLGVPIGVYFRTRPMLGLRKVAWFERAETMNQSACNAFLKTLEEVPDHARVVMTTTQFSRILPTIRSRCLCVACGFEDWGDAGELTAMEKVWARNPGELERLRSQGEPMHRLWSQLEQLEAVPLSGAILLSERAVNYSEEFAKSSGMGNRVAQVYFLDLIGRWWLHRHPDYPSISAECSAIAREILGYSNGQLGFDTLFGMMLAYMREPAGRPGR